ncbi:MAG: sporulation protein [Peptostreptococcaceae bacterium]
MSLFKKVMASALGVGAAKIDTKVHTRNLMPGHKIEGVCEIVGGSVEQYINEIVISVYTDYKREKDDTTITEYQCIQEHVIKIDKNILPGENCEIPFSFILYKRVPVTKHKSKVWLSTRLDIESGVDKSDRDYLDIDYNDLMRDTITAIGELGFSLREVENEYSRARVNGFKFVQEFEFVPRAGSYRGRLDELELVFVHTNTHTDLLLQVDRKVRGLMSFISESMGLDESNLRIRLENSHRYSKEEIKYKIEDLLRQYS